MNLLEAIEAVELFTFVESNDQGLECIKAKIRDGFYFHNKYLLDHDLDALIDYTWQMENFVKVVSETEDEILLFKTAVETIKKYRTDTALKNSITMDNIKFIEDEEVKIEKPKKPRKKTNKINKTNKKLKNKITGGQKNGNKT